MKSQALKENANQKQLAREKFNKKKSLDDVKALFYFLC